MFHVQPFHIFAFYFVLCCGLVDFLKSSVFCENYTGAQGPPLYIKPVVVSNGIITTNLNW